MPSGCEKVSMSDILTYEEIERICKAAADLGIRKIKITGGEPFVRLGCTDLMRQIKAIGGIDEVTVTTNGQSLSKYIDELKDIGIDGINISLDTVDPDKYSKITGGGCLGNVHDSIDAAIASGIKTKVNCVLQHGYDEDEILAIANVAFDKGIDVRFIELMPIGAAASIEGVSNDVVLQLLKSRWPELVKDEGIHGNGPAVYYKRPGRKGGIGLISPMHGKFCDSCNRVRLTSQGQLKPCLCYEEGTDLKPHLAGSDEELKAALEEAILNKPKAHCFTDDEDAQGLNMESRLMSQIGG